MLAITLCLCLASAAFALPPKLPNSKFSNEELQRYFNVDSHEKAPEYEIVYPKYMTAESKRSIGRNAIASSYLEIQVDAFGETIRMELNHDDSNFRSGLEVEYVTDEGSIKVPVRTDCVYTGKVAGEPDSMVSVTTCRGLMAVMNHASGPTYIEPLDDEHARQKGIGRGLPHVAYKKMPDNGASCPVTSAKSEFVFKAEDDNENKKQDFNTKSVKYMELAFIGDAKLYELRGSNTESGLKTLFNAVKNVLQHSSLDGTNLIPVLTHMVVFTSNVGGPKTSSNAQESILNAEKWQYDNRYPSSDSRHWDNAVFLTGWKMRDSGPVLGIASHDPGCGDDNAASVTTFGSLNTTDVVCHEIGHNFGMKHDSEGNACSPDGYVMAPYILNHSGDQKWSTCSKEYYKNFVASKTCYDDISS